MGVLIRGRPTWDGYDEGVYVETRPAINVVSTIATLADDAANDRLKLTIGGSSLRHDNTDHSQRYLHTFAIGGSVYGAGDVAVDATAPAQILQTSATICAYTEGYLVPLAVTVAYRQGTIGVLGIVDVWIDVNGVQRSAKYPLYVDPAQLQRIPVNIGLVPLGGDLIFWGVQKAAATYTITLYAQRRASADPAAATCILSDTATTVIRMVRDLP